MATVECVILSKNQTTLDLSLGNITSIKYNFTFPVSNSTHGDTLVIAPDVSDSQFSVVTKKRIKSQSQALLIY